jgi:uncharacterized protein YndB with AHSA1/START domain
MASESFALSFVSTAPPERVFALLADGAHWADWAGPVVPASRWERKGTPPPGGVGAVRALGSWPLVDLEEVLEHDPPRRHVYTIVSGVPVRDYRGVVELNLTAEGGTRVDWSAEFTPRIPGTGRLFRALSKFVVSQIGSHLVTAAVDHRPEHGTYYG